MSEKREEGFYWAGCGDNREVIYFSSGIGKWQVIGSDNEYEEADFYAIGPRITPPEEG